MLNDFIGLSPLSFRIPTGMCDVLFDIKKGDATAMSRVKKTTDSGKKQPTNRPTDECIMHEDETFHVLFYIHNG